MRTCLRYGAGRGNLLAAMLRRRLNAFGCEPSLQLSCRARAVHGIDCERLVTDRASDFLDGRKADTGRVKVAFLWHVLEHISEPVVLLRRLGGMLKANGAIICQGPLLDPAHVYSEHRYLHCESNIAWLAKSAGLKILMLECQNPERFASFVMSRPEHPAPACSTVSIHDPLGAAGSLYFTLSHALQRIRLRLDQATGDKT